MLLAFDEYKRTKDIHNIEYIVIIKDGDIINNMLRMSSDIK